MGLLSTTTIFIGGEQAPTFKHLYLNQQIDAHHSLEVVFRMDVFEKGSKELGEKSKEFLGKPITIQIGSISSRSKLGVLEFKGIVIGVHITKSNNTGAGDEVTLIAKSIPFLADDAPHYNSYNEKRLGDIVSNVLDAYKINHKIAPRYTELIDYCVQQNESNYAFISRLATQYGEWFYYNGEKVIFGKPETEETQLQHNVDLARFNLSLAPQSNNYKFYTNDYLNDTIEESDKNTKPTGVSSFTGFVYDKSKDIFKKNSIIWNNNNNSPSAKKQLESKVKSQQEAVVINHVQVSGSSENPGVKLGNIVIIDGEKYRITGVAHSTNSSGHYQNNFEAISASFEAYPNTNISAFPKSPSQTAKVMENHDPEGLARVKVQFAWQVAENKTSSWIRIVSPSASKGQGFFFIPEIGDEVYVDFEGGNAECPYVVGSLFNSKTEPPSGSGNKDNHVKMLQSRSGSIVKLNDEDGSVTISDKAGSSISMDGEGNISINANETINIDAKEINLTAIENAKLHGKETTVAGDDKVTINSKEIIAEASSLLELTSNKNMNVNSKTKEESHLKYNLNADTTVDINGTVTTNVKGGIVNLN
ncbi:phage baseplate assembly protein V [uncultured Zobellia sp.]|uniref:type VI secretion system Vgr family protein n=1 Tax=uncultured Zobellia sp. TaxID=255433 RepID=UPI002596811A|nr:phage baseplate assembly protein V [uncultured Zobellia sp.]